MEHPGANLFRLSDIPEIFPQVHETFPQKTIWCYSGYLFDKQILGEMCPKWDMTKEMLSYLDILVDGTFVEEKKNLKLRFRGSENQRIIDVKRSLAQGTNVSCTSRSRGRSPS